MKDASFSGGLGEGDQHHFRWGLHQCEDAADIKGAARLGDSTMRLYRRGYACFVTEV